MSGCSVVVVSYQSGVMLFAVLKRILAQRGLEEVLLMDNGNTPETLSRLQQMALGEERLRIVTGHGNIGLAKACNLGAQQAKGDYILFLQPDCLLPPDALAQAMAALQADGRAAMAGCWLLNPDGSEQRSAHPLVTTPADALRDYLRFGRRLRPTQFVPATPFPVKAIPSSFMMMKRMDFERFRGFDEHYFLCVHDIDLCRRVQLAARTVVCVPGIQVVHLHESSNTGASTAIARAHMRGLIRYYRKHFTGIVPLPALWGLYLLLALRYAAMAMLMPLLRRCGKKPPAAAEVRLRWLVGGLIDLPESDAMAGKRVLVTGASSAIGLCVLRRMLAQGASVVALTRQEPPPFLHERVEWLRGDLAGAVPLEGKVDAVLHCASLWHAPPHLKSWAQMGCTRLVALSSTVLFSRAGSKNWHEKAVADSLAEAEAGTQRLCDEAGVKYSILRPTISYGLGLGGAMAALQRFITRWGFFVVYPPATGMRRPVHVDDVAQAMLRVLDKEHCYGKAYNVSGGEALDYREMVVRCFAAQGRRPRIFGLTLLPLALDVAGRLLKKRELNAEIAYRMNEDLVFFHDAAQADFGYEPRGFQPGRL